MEVNRFRTELSMKKLLLKIKGLLGFLRLIGDMHRTDEVFELAAGLSDPKLVEPIVRQLKLRPAAATGFTVRPRLGVISLAELQKLPTGSLGRVYSDHMIASGLDPGFFPQIPVANDADYLRMHLYETHDLWHVVSGFGTDVAGELGLQALYAAQLPLGSFAPALLSAGLLNAALFERVDLPQRLEQIARGWTMGKSAHTLIGVDWSKLWSMPLETVRANLGIVPENGLALAV
jgi:ubiquinone biosynthesis protein Coq4